MTAIPQNHPLVERLTADRELTAEQAVRAIDKLAEHLADLRKSVIAWNAGESAREPKPYGNAFGDAADAVSAFRIAATAAAVARSYVEREASEFGTHTVEIPPKS